MNLCLGGPFSLQTLTLHKPDRCKSNLKKHKYFIQRTLRTNAVKIQYLNYVFQQRLFEKPDRETVVLIHFSHNTDL